MQRPRSMSGSAAAVSVPALAPISPRRELGAYEALWLENGASFKTIAEKFAARPTAVPSDFVRPANADRCAAQAIRILEAEGVHRFGVSVNHDGDYPARLRDARHPVELLYYQGAWELIGTRCVAVVGNRQATDSGRQARPTPRARAGQTGFYRRIRIGRRDRHRRASRGAGSRTHDRGHRHAARQLLPPPEPRAAGSDRARISADLAGSAPALPHQAVPQNRLFFPERNVTMSALTEATIIVEAGETSGTLHPARAALLPGPQAAHSRFVFRSSGPDVAGPLRAAWRRSRSRPRRYLASPWLTAPPSKDTRRAEYGGTYSGGAAAPPVGWPNHEQFFSDFRHERSRKYVLRYSIRVQRQRRPTSAPVYSRSSGTTAAPPGHSSPKGPATTWSIWLCISITFDQSRRQSL